MGLRGDASLRPEQGETSYPPTSSPNPETSLQPKAQYEAMGRARANKPHGSLPCFLHQPDAHPNLTRSAAAPLWIALGTAGWEPQGPKDQCCAQNQKAKVSQRGKLLLALGTEHRRSDSHEPCSSPQATWPCPSQEQNPGVLLFKQEPQSSSCLLQAGCSTAPAPQGDSQLPRQLVLY